MVRGRKGRGDTVVETLGWSRVEAEPRAGRQECPVDANVSRFHVVRLLLDVAPVFPSDNKLTRSPSHLGSSSAPEDLPHRPQASGAPEHP